MTFSDVLNLLLARAKDSAAAIDDPITQYYGVQGMVADSECHADRHLLKRLEQAGWPESRIDLEIKKLGLQKWVYQQGINQVFASQD